MDLVEIRKKAKNRKKKADTPAATKEVKQPEMDKPGDPERPESKPRKPESEPRKESEEMPGIPEKKGKNASPEKQPETVESPVDDAVANGLSGLESVLMRQRGEVEEEDEEEKLQLLTFMLGQEEYALNIMDIKEIIRPREVTEVPKTPHYIQGILSLRGSIIPVFDVDKRLGLSVAEHGSENRIVVVKWHENLYGLLVDRVVQVLNIPIGLIDPPPEILGGVEGEFLRGVGKLDDRLIILLNLGRILSLDEVDSAAEPEFLPGSQRNK